MLFPHSCNALVDHSLCPELSEAEPCLWSWWGKLATDCKSHGRPIKLNSSPACPCEGQSASGLLFTDWTLRDGWMRALCVTGSMHHVDHVTCSSAGFSLFPVHVSHFGQYLFILSRFLRRLIRTDRAFKGWSKSSYCNTRMCYVLWKNSYASCLYWPWRHLSWR